MGVYTFWRFGTEMLRADSDRGIWLSLSTSQWVSVLGLPLIAWVWRQWSRNPHEQGKIVMGRTLLLLSLLTCVVSAAPVHATKLVYWPLEDTEKLYQPQLKVAKQIVWQQLKSIDGVSKHKIIKKDRQRLRRAARKQVVLKSG